MAGKAFSKILGALYVALVTFLCRFILLPSWTIGKRTVFRGRVRRRSFAGDVIVGEGCEFGHSTVIDCARGGILKIGNGSSINHGVTIVCRQAVTIGNDVRIAEYAAIRDNDHAFGDVSRPIAEQGYDITPVTIEDDVWSGRCVTIMQGVTIGKGAIIGANSVVLKDVEANTIVAGAPARLIKKRS